MVRAPHEAVPASERACSAAGDVALEQAWSAVVGAERELPAGPDLHAYPAWVAELYALEQPCWVAAVLDVGPFAERACFEAAPV